MNSLNELILLLEATISDPDKLEKNISKFQEIVWNEELDCSDRQEEILADLAYDLDFYEPNPEWRKEDPSYFGEERAINEIKGALDRIKSNR